MGQEHDIIDLLKRLSGMSDSELGKSLGMSRERFERLRSGRTKLTYGDGHKLAKLFDVPLSIFAMSEAEALTTVAELRSDQAKHSSTWKHAAPVAA